MGNGGTGTTVPKKPCYFFNHGGCHNSDEKCRFKHVIVTPEEKAQMVKPESRDSRSPSARRGKGAGKGAGGGGGGGGGAAPASAEIKNCFKFLKGECTKGDDCMFAHVPQEVVDELKRAKSKAKAKAKSKAAAKPKAKAGAFKPNDSQE